MKSLLVAFVCALLGITLVFLALSWAGLDKAVAGPIATAIIGGVPSMREALDKQWSEGADGTRAASIASLQGYGLGTARLALYGSLILFAVVNFGSGLAGFVAALVSSILPVTTEAEVTLMLVLPAVGLLALVFVLPGVYFVGKWMGRHAVSRGILAVFIACVFARTMTSVLDNFLLTIEERMALFGDWLSWEQITGGVVMYFTAACLGYWRGRRQRLASYLAYLLKRVSPDTRDAIVDLAYAEAFQGTRLNTGA